jgi:DNA-binding CsgD family transcriptional regulator
MIAAMDVEELLAEGRAALAAADWARALECFERAGEHPAALKGLSEAARFAGRYEDAIAFGERAFAANRDAGDMVAAADCARWLAFCHGTYHGDFAVASGWMARAASAMEGSDESAAHGWLILDRAPFSQDTAERANLATAALAIARRYGDADLQYHAMSLLGESLVASGRIAEGMRLLDETMAAVMAGEVADHGIAGEIACRLLSACERAVDVRRARQWMAHVGRHVKWTDFVRPTCRTHYGAILVALGRWREAEAELLDAIAAFERGWRADRAFAMVRLADLRVLQGRYEEAERLLEGLEWHPIARRAAAAIAFARADLALAGDLALLCMEGADPGDPAGPPLLGLLVAIALARGDVDAAREAAGRLAERAATAEDARCAAFAALAAGCVRAAAGDAGGAADVKRAVERFAELELPLELARAQLELARCAAAATPRAAVAEARRALAAFERLGAVRDADAAGALLRELGASGRTFPRGAGELTAREREVLALLAAGLANADIAERLVISRRTAEHHVARILAKLGLRTRAEAAAYAVRERLQDP